MNSEGSINWHLLRNWLSSNQKIIMTFQGILKRKREKTLTYHSYRNVAFKMSHKELVRLNHYQWNQASFWEKGLKLTSQLPYLKKNPREHLLKWWLLFNLHSRLTWFHSREAKLYPYHKEQKPTQDNRRIDGKKIWWFKIMSCRKQSLTL